MTTQATIRQQLEQADSLFILSTSAYALSPAGYVYEQTSHFDRSCYADIPGMTDAQLDAAVQEDWENIWTQGDDVYVVEEAAEAEADARYERGEHRPVVVEITRRAVKDALVRHFGDAHDEE